MQLIYAALWCWISFRKVFKISLFAFGLVRNGREVDKEGLWNRAEEVPDWPEPLCCDSIMEISAFLHSQRSFTIWLFIFTFRAECSVSPQNTQSDCGSGERLFSFPVKHLLLGIESVLHPLNINGWYMQIGFQRSMWWQDESPLCSGWLFTRPYERYNRINLVQQLIQNTG